MKLATAGRICVISDRAYPHPHLLNYRHVVRVVGILAQEPILRILLQVVSGCVLPTRAERGGILRFK